MIQKLINNFISLLVLLMIFTSSSHPISEIMRKECDGCLQTARPLPSLPPQSLNEINTKWDLWSAGTTLRGANIWQAAIYQDSSETEVSGMETVYSDKDFEHLRRWKANYINISHPGIYSETLFPVSDKPGTFTYQLNKRVLDNLAELVEKAKEKHLFVVISYRTGPGRNERNFSDKKHIDELKAGKKNDSGETKDQFYRKLRAELFKTDASGNLTKEAEKAQAGWIEMWKETVTKFKDYPNIVGYDLMVEPVSEFEVLGKPGEVSDEAKIAARQKWFEFARKIVSAIRSAEVALGIVEGKRNPILIGGSNYSNACSLSCFRPAEFNDFGRIIYTAHQYAPNEYTHQSNKFAEFECKNGTPEAMGQGRDHKPKTFNNSIKKNLENRYQWMNGFKETNNFVPVAINEFGVSRWAGKMDDGKHFPDASNFLIFHVNLIERLGANHALWLWEVDDCIGYDDMNYRHGTNPRNHTNIKPEDEVRDPLIKAIKDNWANNRVYATPEFLTKFK